MTLRLAAVLAALAALGGVGVSPAPAAVQTRSLVIYLKATRLQFLNHADDRARGDVTSPFDPDAKLTPPTNANSGAKGTRAGDQALFSFKLYSDLALTKPIGTAVYTCTFNFAQQAACDANFQLNKGTVFASGPADLLTGNFTLAVIGGTSGYLGIRGQVTSSPTGHQNTTRLDFILLPLTG